MTRHTWYVFSYELIRNLKRKGFLFTSFGIPIIGFLIVFAITNIGGSSPEEQQEELQEYLTLEQVDKVGYVDASGMFADPHDLAEVMIPFSDEDTARTAMEAEEIDLFYLIPENYMETGEVRMIVPHFSPNYLGDSERPIELLLFVQWLDRADQGTLLRLLDPAFVERVEFQRTVAEEGEAPVEDGVTRNEDNEFWAVYAFAIIFMLALFGTNGYLMQTVIEEKETRLIEILISSVRPVELLMGKILAMGVLGIIQVLAYLSTMIVLAQVASGSSQLGFLNSMNIELSALPLLIIYFILGYLMFASVFGAVGALSNSMSEGPSLTAIFTLPALAPLFVIQLFVDEPNGTVATVMSIFPLTSPLGMIMRTAVTDVPAAQIALSLLLLALTVVAMIWMAGRLFRVQMLLSGQVPKLRELPKLLLGS